MFVVDVSWTPGLLHGGRVHGTVELVGCEQVSHDDLADNVDKHGVHDLSQISYTRTFAWQLASPFRFHTPLPHNPRQGARKWVSLTYPDRAQKTLALIKAAEKADEAKGLEELALQLRVRLYAKSKVPYWKIHEKDLDNFQKKFEFDKDNFVSMKSSALRAMQLQHALAGIEDELSCVASSEIKGILEAHGLSKHGGKEILRQRAIKHRLEEHLSAERKRRKLELASSPAQGLPAEASNGGKGKEQEDKAKESKQSEEGEKQEDKGMNDNEGPKGSMNCKFFVLASVFHSLSTELAIKNKTCADVSRCVVSFLVVPATL